MQLTQFVGCAALKPSTEWMHLPGSRARVELPEETPGPAPKPIAENSPDAETAQASVGAARQHSPATRMLIDAELKDATPEERAEWVAYLNSVEASQVPYILRARRMASNRKLEQVVPDRDAKQLAVVSPELSVKPVSEEAPATGRLPQITPAGGVARPHPESIASEHPEAPAPSPAAAPGLSQRIRDLAAPTWTWMQPSEDAAPHSERSMFGLPPRLGSNPKQVPPAEAPEANPSVQVASAPAGLQVTPGSKLWEDELRKVISLLEAEGKIPAGKDAAAQFEHRRRQVALRMLHLVNDDPNLAQQSISTLPPAEQEFWTALFVALSDVQDPQLTEEARNAQLVAQLRVAAQNLQKIAPLQLKHLTRCDEINGFGNYLPAHASPVAPGQSVLIYTEIRNFHSEPTPEGFYRTAIGSTVEIVGPNGKVVDRKAYPAEDLCRSLRSDYFHSYRIDLPPGLMTGAHSLRLTIRDELTGRTATESVTFTVE